MKEMPSIDCFSIFGFKHFIDDVKHAKRADMTCWEKRMIEFLGDSYEYVCEIV